MGCMSANTAERSNQLKNQIKMLRIMISSKVNKLHNEAVKQQEILKKMIMNDPKQRAQKPQYSVAEQITQNANKIHCFEVVRMQLQKILQYVHHVDDIEKAKITLFPSFRIVLYQQSILKDENIDNLCGKIKKKYKQFGLKQAEEEQITSQIMKYHKKSQLPSFSMINNYILMLCSQQKTITLEQINQIGHNFHYGA